MTNRFNITAVTTFEDKDGKERKQYTRCGVAFVNNTKSGEQVLNLEFDFIPVAAPGRTLQLVGFEPKAKEDDSEVTE